MWYYATVNNWPVAETLRALSFVGGVMMPKRSSERDTAKAEYIARKSKGEKVNLRELAESMGVAYSSVRNWKREDKWDDALPKKKRGGQPGAIRERRCAIRMQKKTELTAPSFSIC